MDPGAGADAAHADHLAGGVQVTELLDGVAAAHERLPVGLMKPSKTARTSSQPVPGRIRSSMGTISGGSATICSSSSTMPVRLAKTRMLSRRPRLGEVLRRLLGLSLARRRSRTSVRIQVMTSSMFI